MRAISRQCRFAIAIAAISAAVLVPVSGASASQVTFNGSVLTYTAGSGEANMPIVTVNPYELLCDPLPAPCLSIFDPGAYISAPAGQCTGAGSTEVQCTVPSALVANLGDREDSFYDWDGDSTINGGAGNDNPITGNGGNDRLNGGVGSDNLVGGPGDDVIDGGPGNDYLEGIAYTSEADSAGRDTYIGGGDSDILNLDGRSEDLALSPDGVANDGAAGEGDNIGPDVLTIVGGHGADTFNGNASGNAFEGGEGNDTIDGAGGDDNLVGGAGNDRLAGGDGQDVLGGESGDDVLDGGAGVDRFWGDSIGACIPGYCSSGQDQIHARDGAQETLNCGPGTDSAQVDASDYVVTSPGETDQCESIDRAAGPPGGETPPGGTHGGGRLGILVTYKAPGRGLLIASGTARNGSRVIRVGRALRRVRRAGRVKITLPISDAATRLLNARGSLRVQVRTTFKRKRGRPLVQRRSFTLRPVGS
jgi:RTX calcium-binding nonapeptide repeat (4 copies)